jgi:hypothetical protein
VAQPWRSFQARSDGCVPANLAKISVTYTAC